jgi:hypothetical protein
VALSPDIHSLFEDVPLSRIKRIIAGQPVRLVPMEGELFILVRNFEQMILVEPRIRPGGDLYITYGLRDDVALADYLGRLGCSRKEPTHDYRRSRSRRLGRAGTVA